MPTSGSTNNINNPNPDGSQSEEKLLAVAKKVKEKKIRKIQKQKDRRKKAINLLARAEVAQNAEGIPYLPKIEDHSGASNVNITPKAAVKEVKDAKPGQFPKVGL